MEDTIAEGVAQTWHYMDRVNTMEGHLIIFDRDPAKAWADKIFVRSEPYNQMTIKVWGM